MAWICALAALYLSPGLFHGASFGPFDLGSSLSGLGRGLYPHVHNAATGDQIEELIPWNLFDWRQIHLLRFPLWNPYSGFGMPEFFNWQSSALSLPDLVSYLFPAHLAFLAAVAAKLVLAGTGAYVFGRVAGLPPLAAAFAATVFELGGPFVSEVGWPLADVMAWIGWIFAFTWLIVERRPPVRRWIVLLALCVAFAVYGGFPEADLLLGGAYAVYFGLLLLNDATSIWSDPKARTSGPGARPARDTGQPAPGAPSRRNRRRAVAAVVCAWAIGLCLSAPLWLPGLQLLLGSARLTLGQRPAIPLRALSDLFLQGYYGFPLHGSQYFGPFSYYETVAYLGVAALVLAGVAILRWRGKRALLPLVAASAILAALGYNTGIFALLISYIPSAGALIPGRVRLPLAFLLAMLAGFGLHEVVSRWGEAATRRAYRQSLGAVSAVVAVLFAHAWLARGSLSAGDATTRLHSFVWPTALLAGMALADAAATMGPRLLQRRAQRQVPARPARVSGSAWSGARQRAGWAGLAGTCLLAAEAAFLLAAGSAMNTYSTRFLPQSAAERQLSAVVGHSLVGFSTDKGGPTHYAGLGLIPEMNVAYRIRELAIYDPMIPDGYFKAWQALTGAKQAAAGWFAPGIPNASLARLLGVGYVLAPGTGAPPPGMSFAADIGGERLYRVPGASRFSLQGTGPGDRIVSARQTGNASWAVQVDAAHPLALQIRLTDVPGWHAEIDGRPASPIPWLDVLQQVPLPAGRHTVQLWYWPPLFTAGLALCLAGALAALALLSGRLHAIFTDPAETGGTTYQERAVRT